jgi:hypothetical protein
LVIGELFDHVTIYSLCVRHLSVSIRKKASHDKAPKCACRLMRHIRAPVSGPVNIPRHPEVARLCLPESPSAGEAVGGRKLVGCTELSGPGFLYYGIVRPVAGIVR